LALLLGAVGLRSWVFVWFPHSHFDSDQAIFGLMAKDLVAGRSLPAFTYGRGYMLAVSVWLTAPLFALFGPSVVTLKLPMLAMNLAVIAMLWFGLRREGLSRIGTTLSILPFAVPGVVTSSRLVEHAGGNIEPFPIVLGAFFLRRRPVLLGLVMGVGFLNREFALIGFVALIVMDLLEGQLLARLKQRVTSAAVILVVVTCIREVARRYGRFDNSGPPPLGSPALENVAGFFQVQIPSLLGSSTHALREFNVTSSLQVGHGLVYWAVGAWLVLFAVSVIRLRPQLGGGLPSYLVLVGGGQALAFMLLVAAPSDLMLLRYVLLVLFALVGCIACAWQIPQLRAPTAVVVLAVTAINSWDSVRLAHEYVARSPKHENELLAAALVDRGIHYARADYWVAYDIAFLTNERIIASSPADARIVRYVRELERHAREVVTISTDPCGGWHFMRWDICRNVE
jgi:hypothetical protein